MLLPAFATEDTLELCCVSDLIEIEIPPVDAERLLGTMRARQWTDDGEKVGRNTEDRTTVPQTTEDDSPLAVLLSHLGLFEHLALCLEQELDVEALGLTEIAELTAADVGMPESHARRIVHYFAAMRE